MNNHDLFESLRKLHGLPPYNEGINPCLNDSHMSTNLVRTYGEAEVSQAMRKLGLGHLVPVGEELQE